MLVYAGIDEAGYGPRLGPLCVGCAVFIVQGHDPAAGAPDLWRMLRRAVCRSRSDRRNRIAIEDSKKLKGPNNVRAGVRAGVRARGPHPLRHLERGVLAMCSAAGEKVASDADLFQYLGAAVCPACWYESQTPLPVAIDAGEGRINAARLRRAMDDAGVACAQVACSAVDAGEFNRLVSRTGTKASVNLSAALRLVDQIWGRWRQEHPRVILDRHGGRTRYREELQFAWPEAHIQILAEDDRQSRYRLDRAGALLTVSFIPEAESRHLPVALASMTAKYVRELFMLRMNRFFSGHLPELKPTAGYYGDAGRFLEAVSPLIERLGLPESELVRAR